MTFAVDLKKHKFTNFASLHQSLKNTLARTNFCMVNWILKNTLIPSFPCKIIWKLLRITSCIVLLL